MNTLTKSPTATGVGKPGGKGSSGSVGKRVSYCNSETPKAVLFAITRPTKPPLMYTSELLLQGLDAYCVLNEEIPVKSRGTVNV